MFTPMLRLSLLLPRLALLLSSLAVLLGAAGAHAADPASPWDRNDQAAVRLVAAVTAVGDAATLPAGLQLQLQPGWKTYWRSPGDAGFPVSIDWKGSRNLKSAAIAWPAPHRFALLGLETFGYGGEVVLPVTVTPATPSAPVALRAAVDYLVCEKICVPRHADLALDLPAGPAAPSAFVQLIDRFRHQVPDDGSGHGLSLAGIGIGGTAAAPTLEVEARSTMPFAAPDLIVEAPVGLHFGAPKVTLSEGGRAARLSLPVGRDDQAPALAGARLVLTLVDGERGLEQAVVPTGPLAVAATAAAPPAAQTSPPPPERRLLGILLLGLLGGLVLNLMPCVLPVLSLKLLGIVGHGGRERREVRFAFLASAAGVLVSFLALAGLLILLRAGGVAIGWGIQFQQPLFLAAMVVVLTLFACNMLGWFEVPLPGWLGDLAGALPGEPGRHGLIGNFLTGALATLLATPCSAPFLGTAIGFAMAGSAGEILAIFAAIAVGLSLPYLAVAAWPGLATRLPRPGRWMLWLRALLGLLLAGTAVWLLDVLMSEAGMPAALLVALLAVALALLLWGRRRLPPRLGSATAGFALLLALAALAAPVLLAAPAPASRQAAEPLWQPFQPERIAALVAGGKVVFVDVTADWCITCQVNKKLVIDTPAVQDRLAGGTTVAMRADWTRPSEAIARYLAGFGRYGIPFNAVYGPRAPQGVALPELLTPGAVEDGFRQAGG
jgi:suppressor for copper-sensitivity B